MNYAAEYRRLKAAESASTDEREKASLRTAMVEALRASAREDKAIHEMLRKRREAKIVRRALKKRLATRIGM